MVSTYNYDKIEKINNKKFYDNLLRLLLLLKLSIAGQLPLSSL